VGRIEARLRLGWDSGAGTAYALSWDYLTVSAATFDEIDFEYATSVADKAMRGMMQQRVPPTPNNFHLWFKYSLGTASDLKRAIDILISNKRKFDKTTNQALFETYIGSQGADAAVVHKVSQQLHGVMDSAKLYLTAAIAENRTQMQAIDGVAESHNDGVSPKLLIENLVSELAKATARAAKLEASFAEKSRELDTIRDSLNKSEQRARTDTLTGLPNRRALEEFFRQVQIAAMEKDEPLSVLLIDVDHFKKFNDNYGHGVGDQVLRLVAKAVRARVRENDLPARYGGEELIAVLPRADLETCCDVAERIRRSIAECQFTRRSTGEMLPQITVSIGVGQFQFGESMADLIDRCDRALYLAKKLGRNRVVTELELDRKLAVG
jgi:diguanylate cyclase